MKINVKEKTLIRKGGKDYNFKELAKNVSTKR